MRLSTALLHFIGVLFFLMQIRLYKRRRSVVEAKDLMQSTEEELHQYKILFDQVDKNGSGWWQNGRCV